MTTMADIRDWARGSDRGAGECQGFVGNDMCGHFGSFTRWYNSALEAAGDSALVGDYPGAPSFVYLRGQSGELLKYGHVAFGTPSELFMTSSYVTTALNSLGTVGSCSLEHYMRATGATLLGWAPTNGKNTMPPVSDGTKQQGDIDMRVLYNLDNSDDATRRAIIGELSFQVITGPQSTRERKFWGEPVNVTNGEWDAALDLVNARRKTLGLPVQAGGGGAIDFTPVLDAVGKVPAATRAEFASNPLG